MILGVNHQYGSLGTTIDRSAAKQYYAQVCRAHDGQGRCGFVLDLDNDEMSSEEQGSDVYEATCPGTLEEAESIEHYARECADACLARSACDHWLQMHCESDIAACERSCDEGDAATCRQLFLMQRSGQGTGQDNTLAEARRTQACTLGDRFSCDAGDKGMWVASAKVAPQAIKLETTPET